MGSTRLFVPHTELEPAGQFLPIDLPYDEDFFLVSYPKSGVTWFQTLVAGLVYRVDPVTAPDALIQGLVPDVHDKPKYQRYGTRSFFKSHSLPVPQYRNVVYLLRDGRDVMVSYRYHLGAMEPPPQELRDFVARTDLYPSPWHHHVEGWLENKYQARMLVLRYEELLSDTVGQLRKFCQFVGLDAETELLEAVADRASFQNLRDKESRLGLSNPKWPKGVHFYRRGLSGSHRDEMSPEAMREFLKLAGPTLERCGYLTDSDQVIRRLAAEVDRIESLLEADRENDRQWKSHSEVLAARTEELAASLARTQADLRERESRLEDLERELGRLRSENDEARSTLDAIRRSVFTRLLTSAGIWRVFR